MRDSIRASTNNSRKVLDVLLFSSVFVILFSIVIWKSHTSIGFGAGL